MLNNSVARRMLNVLIVISGTLLIGWQIAEAHNWFPDDGCKPGLSDNGYFWAAGPASYWVVDTSSGWNGCHMRTRNTQSSIINWSEWYLPIDSNYNHNYSVQAYIQSSRTDLTTNAHYRGWANGHSGGITANFYQNQNANRGGYCYILGSTQLNGSNGGLMDLIDLTGESFGTKYVVFDDSVLLAKKAFQEGKCSINVTCWGSPSSFSCLG